MRAIRTRQVLANGLTFTLDEAGEGEAVALLLHGFPESRRSWRMQLSALAGLGWRACAPDLRGYGASDRPAGRRAYRLDELVADVAGLFDALGARRRLLIGHDWGGVIAWAFAARAVRALNGLVILNAPHPAHYRLLLQRSPAQWAKSWYVLFFQLPWLPEALLRAHDGRALRRAFPDWMPRDLVDHYVGAARTPAALTAMINYYRANVIALGQRNPQAHGRIDVPALVVWGEQDRFLSRGLAQPGPDLVADLTVARLAGAGHWVQQQDPEGVNRQVAEWLAAKGLAWPS
jgi:pimeloyl-ACP methyl ester carboxylesterase